MTANAITIGHEAGGITENFGVYSYKAGTLKALYCLLGVCTYNMVAFNKHLKENEFIPFPDDEYTTRIRTPDPGDRVKDEFRLEDGKWV